MNLVDLYFVSLEYKHPKSFLWEKYLEETGTQAAPARAFKPVWFTHVTWYVLQYVYAESGK